jgi:DNA modification methylase
LSARIIVADVLEGLGQLADESVQCVVTSPPYWGLRDYGTASWEGGDPACDHQGDARYYTEKTAGVSSSGAFSDAGPENAARLKAGRWREAGTCRCGALYHDRQIGLERTPAEYLDKMVAVFREVRRVLRQDGTLWLNLGDCYNAFNGGAGPGSGEIDGPSERSEQRPALPTGYGLRDPALKPKDMVGIPWRVAFALQADGWWLRSDIVWAKPNPMPESVTDRPTKAHEYLFLMARSERYYYDADAIAEPATSGQPLVNPSGWARGPGAHDPISHNIGSNEERRERAKPWPRPGNEGKGEGSWAFEASDDGIAPRPLRNRRTVWEIATKPFPEAHFATFPTALVEPCILAGTPLGAAVLDPFCGSGTVGLVCDRLGRDFIGIELNPAYALIAERRITGDSPLFAEVAVEKGVSNG